MALASFKNIISGKRLSYDWVSLKNPGRGHERMYDMYFFLYGIDLYLEDTVNMTEVRLSY